MVQVVSQENFADSIASGLVLIDFLLNGVALVKC